MKNFNPFLHGRDYVNCTSDATLAPTWRRLLHVSSSRKDRQRAAAIIVLGNCSGFSDFTKVDLNLTESVLSGVLARYYQLQREDTAKNNIVVACIRCNNVVKKENQNQRGVYLNSRFPRASLSRFLQPASRRIRAS